MNVIILNDKDKAAFQWLKDRVGEKGIERGISLLAGARKPYATNIAKALGLDIPKDLYLPASPEVARLHIEKMRAMFKTGKPNPTA